MGPYYGKASTFVLKDAEKICLPPSEYFMDYSESEHSEYYSQAIQTYTKDAETDYNVEWIGEFWSDDLLNLTFSPGPRWVAIGNQIIEKEDIDLERALEAYAKTGMSSVQEDRQSQSKGKWCCNNMPTMQGFWRHPASACNCGERN